MITLSPLEYPKLTPITLTLVKYVDTTKTLTIVGDFQAYSGQILTVTINNTEYSGKFIQSSDGSKHIKLLESLPSDFNITSADTISVLNTFKISDSNKTITFQDVYDYCNPKTSTGLSPEYIEDIGKSGLLTGFDKLKLDGLLYDFKKQKTVTINNNLKQIAEFSLNTKTISRFRLFLYSDNYHIQFNFWCTPNLINYGIENCNINGNFQVKFLKKTYEDNTVTLSVEIASRISSEVIAEDKQYTVFIGNSWVLADTSNKVMQSSDALPLKTDIFDNNLISVTENTSHIGCSENETLLKSTEFKQTKLYSAKDGYYLILENQKPSDVPEGTTFNSATFVANSKTGSYLFITDNNQIFVGKKDLVNNKIVWNELASKTHTHPATDIAEDSLHRFVTDDEKDKWNSTIQNISNSFWKNPVSNETKLPTNSALNTVVLVNQHSKYGNNLVAMQRVSNSDWLPLNLKVFQTDITNRSELYPGLNGSLVSPEMLERLGSLGIGKQLGTLEQYIHALTDKTKYSATNNVFLDLVKRTELTTIGNKTVSIGFENATQIGSESVVIGNNIQQTLTSNILALGSGLIGNTNSKVLLGSYNLKNTEHKVIFGDGTSDVLRSNLFWIDKNDKITVKSTGAFKIDGIHETEILTSGGHIPQDSFVKASEFKQFKDNLPSGEFFSFFEHEAKDPANTVPIIVSISTPETLTYYKNKIES